MTQFLHQKLRVQFQAGTIHKTAWMQRKCVVWNFFGYERWCILGLEWRCHQHQEKALANRFQFMRARPLEVLENPVTKTIRLSMLQIWIVDQVKAMKRAEIHGVILFMFIAASLASFSHHSLFSRTNFRLVHVTYVFHKFSIHEMMIVNVCVRFVISIARCLDSFAFRYSLYKTQRAIQYT